MRILGIDLGSSSIKAVEIDSAFGRYEIHDYYEHPIILGSNPHVELGRFLASLPKPPDRVAIALSTGKVTFRNLSLPTRDKKSIQSSVAFELDDELPFPIEKAAYDYSILSQTKQGTNLHVAATLKSTLLASLQTWAEAGVSPDLVTSESWAYRTLLSKIIAKTDQEEPILLIQVGNERTTLYVHWNGSPILARELGWGGRDLTQAIARKYNLSFEQAEQAKLDHGFVVPSDQQHAVSPEQIEFSETLLAVLQTLFVEIRQVELTCKSVTHRAVTQAYVAGGSMLLPGLTRVIEEGTRLPVRQLRSLSSIATSGVTYSEQTDAVFLLAAATAFCLVGAERGGNVNFRKGEFSKGGRQAEFNITMLKGPLISGAAISACLVASLAVQTVAYNKRLTEIDAQMERGLKSLFGSMSASAIRSNLASPSSLRTKIKTELAKQRDLAKLGSPNPNSPLDFLNALSSSVSRDVVTDLLVYQTGAAPGTPYAPDSAQNTTLSFLVPDAATATRLESMLQRSVKGMKRDKTESVTGPDGTKQVRVTFSGKPVTPRGY